MKKIIIGIIVFVVVLAFTLPIYADEVKPPEGDHYTFNAVTELDPLADNEILVPLNGTGALGWVVGDTFLILDNDMTDDGLALVQVPAGIYATFDQVRGKPGGNLTWGNYHERFKGKPVWVNHNNPTINWQGGLGSPWAFTNNGITCYTFRLYMVP